MEPMSGRAGKEILVSTDWLARHLDDRDLRIIDVSVVVERAAGGKVTFAGGADEYRQAHIPGAGFLDLQGDLSAEHPRLVFMMPEPEHIAAALTSRGIDEHSRVVLYNRGPSWWATRVWFMLEEIGFDNAAVLDGGFDKWVAEDRPVESGDAVFPGGDVRAKVGRRNFVGKSDVLRALGQETHLVNALSAEQHEGQINPYGRPGHIPGSVNVPATSVLAEDGCFKSTDELAKLFPAGAPTIHYCGGGISASLTAFAQRLAGEDVVQIYDGSLSEWARDPKLPLTVEG